MNIEPLTAFRSRYLKEYSMNTRMIIAAAVLVAAAGGPGLAQDAAGTGISLPDACQKAAQMPGEMGDMGMGKMMESMQRHMGGSMSEATRGYMQAMITMHMPMMQGAMAQDADVAFNCSMIAHHLGAIVMAKVELQHGKDEEARKMAQKIIDEQSREVQEMTKWVEEHGKQ
jgi:uncharacterized protein (DUF305 family)